MLIGIDFDNTLVKGAEALPGARDAINILREQGHKIMIFSCNNKEWIERVMRENDMRYDYIWEGAKPVCHVYIDDRNLEFNGDWDETLKRLADVGDKVNMGLW